MSQFLSFLLDPHALIATFGVLGVITVVFLETGAFFGFFFPGDSLLFTAGFFASQGYVSLGWLLVGHSLPPFLAIVSGTILVKKIGPIYIHQG